MSVYLSRPLSLSMSLPHRSALEVSYRLNTKCSHQVNAHNVRKDCLATHGKFYWIVVGY